MDIRPAAPGHVLVVPRIEVDRWTDIEPELAAHLMKVAQIIGQAQIKVFGAERAGLLIAGFEVAHCHLHVIPANSMADFEIGQTNADPQVLKTQAAELAAALGKTN